MIKILVVDDEAIVRISCQKALAGGDYEVKTASSGEEGLEMIKKESFQIVLLDLKMPDIDGLEVLKVIKETSPDTKVIMITGYSTVDTAVSALKLGAVNYLEKPFNPDALLEAIKEVI